jgi:hypothetical protein
MENAASAIKMLARSKSGLQSITTTSAEDSEDSSVPIVTIVYSDGTEIVIYLEGWPTISTETLSNGLFRLEWSHVKRNKGNVLTPTIEWCAGFFEGEGCARVREHFKNDKKYSYYVLQIAQVHREPLDAFREAMGLGVVRGPYGPYSTTKQAYYLFDAATDDALVISEKMLPFLYSKGDQVRAAIQKYKENNIE